MKWWWYPAVLSVACIGYFLSPSVTGSQFLFVVIGLSSVVAVVLGIRLRRPASVAAWSSIALGTALWVVGDVGFLWISHVDGSVPVPSFADPIYLLGYPVFSAGLFLLVHRRARRGEFGHVANSVIVMIAFGLLMWVFVVETESVDISTAAGLVTIAYPALDLYLLGLLVHFIGTVHWRNASFRLVTASVVAILAADVLSNITLAATSPAVTIAADVGYLAFYVLIGTAALHPSMGTLAAPRADRGSSHDLVASFSTPTVIVLTIAVLTAPAVMAILLARGTPVTQWGWGVVLCATLLVVLVFVRVTELLRLLHRQTDTLRSVAETDHLTDQLNRRGLETWIHHHQGPLAVLLIDIDRFEEINDTFGHGVGDEVLRAVAARLTTAFGRRGAVARLGADEFAIALPAESATDAEATAHEVQATLLDPIRVGGATLLVEASVGIAASTGTDDTGTDEGADSGKLLRRASLAVQSAKSVQPRIARYETTMDRDSSKQLLLLGDLTTAVGTRQLELYYQLQVDLSTMKVVGVEALLRWNHPDRGVLEPDLFLPIAERTGLIRPLANFALTEALEQCRAWRSEGLDLTVSVNISTRNLLDTSLVEQVRRALSDTGVSPEQLTIEITETTSMTDPTVAIAALVELRRLGVCLAIDDYGTGYSSLSYLQRLPMQQLKLDKTFVTDMKTAVAHEIIVRSTIDLARTLGLTVTAEGVEDRETLLALRSLSCHTAQGYFLGRPVPARHIPAAVAKTDAELMQYSRTYEPR